MYQVTGFEAACMTIGQFGLIGFLKELVRWCLRMVPSIFIDCAIFGAWTKGP
jgi:hypothetical protein